MTNIENRLIAIVRRYMLYCDDSPDVVTASSSFAADIGADSIDSLEIIMAIEQEFGVEILSSDVEQIVTVGDAIRFVEQRQTTA